MIGVIAESLNLVESLDGYTFVLSSCFEMLPQFDRRSIKIIFCDEFITQTLLSNLQISSTAMLRCDRWHILNEVLPKHFGLRWNQLKGPMTAMIDSKSESEWDEAFQEAKKFVDGHPDLVDYIRNIHRNPNKYSGHILRRLPGNLKRVGSTSAEQNHSSIIAHLGNSASWSLNK